MGTIRVHVADTPFHPLSSFCWKALIGLYELEIPFEKNVVDLSKYIDRLRSEGPRLIPASPDRAIECRLRDRLYDMYIHLSMQKIVGDKLRPEDKRDPFGVEQARGQMETAYALVDDQLRDGPWAMGDDFTVSRRCKGGGSFKRARSSLQNAILCAFREIRAGSRTILAPCMLIGAGINTNGGKGAVFGRTGRNMESLRISAKTGRDLDVGGQSNTLDDLGTTLLYLFGVDRDVYGYHGRVLEFLAA